MSQKSTPQPPPSPLASTHIWQTHPRVWVQGGRVWQGMKKLVVCGPWVGRGWEWVVVDCLGWQPRQRGTSQKSRLPPPLLPLSLSGAPMSLGAEASRDVS